MSFEITTAFVQQYRNTVQMLLQQKDSRFENAVMGAEPYTGKDVKAVEQIGPVTARKRTTRHSDTPLISTPHDARWVSPVDYDWADLIDRPDRVRMIINPQDSYALNGANAMRRAKDDEIIEAFFATARTGENGTTLTPFPTATQQIVHGGFGMTVQKLRTAKKLLMAAEVDDDEPLFVALSAEQHDDLLGETQAISIDYTDKPVLADGRIKRFMGFNFIQSERLQVTGTVRRNPCWAKSGMHLGTWEEMISRVDELPGKSYSTQVFNSETIGATRLEEKKVVEIQCQE